MISNINFERQTGYLYLNRSYLAAYHWWTEASNNNRFNSKPRPIKFSICWESCNKQQAMPFPIILYTYFSLPLLLFEIIWQYSQSLSRVRIASSVVTWLFRWVFAGLHHFQYSLAVADYNPSCNHRYRYCCRDDISYAFYYKRGPFLLLVCLNHLR